MKIRVSQSQQSDSLPLAQPQASITKLDSLNSAVVKPKKPTESARFGIFYNTPRQWLIVGVAVVVVALAGAGFLVWHNSQNADSSVAGASTDDVSQLLDKVGTLIVLPTGEQPTVATVSDKDKLKDQPFFTNAENGDKVIIYPNAKKAYLYRPSINKIIDVAPVSFGDTTTTK